MKHLRRLLVSLGAAWGLSIAALLGIGFLSESARTARSADLISEFFQALLLFGFYSLLCIGAAWVLLAVPYYFLFLQNCKKWPLILHSLIAGTFGFGFMMLATQILPITHDSWRFTSPIAFAAGLFGTIMVRYDLFLTKTRKAEQADAGKRAKPGAGKVKKLAPLLVSLVLAVVVGLTARYSIREEMLPWRVTDAEGHGPDYGSLEWRNALEKQARIVSISVSMISFFTVFAVIRAIRRKGGV
jgi:hypothetical protein